jgi:hypothetical protein
MIKKVVLSLSLALLTASYSFAQAAQSVQTPDQRAKAKSEAVAKFIDSKITDVAKKLNGGQKKSMKDAQLAYETGIDSVKAAKAELPKRVEEIKAKAAAVPKEVATEEEAAKAKAENEAILKMQESLKADQTVLNARPDQLRTKLEEDMKKVLKGDQAKAYDLMLAEQKAKKKAN